jgi:DNA-binding transcriptional LysR family regulator
MTYSSLQKLPPIDSLLAGLMAYKTGSFSAAALELGVTHAAISRRVDVLENWAGQKIFQRQARGVLVNEVGQRILVRIEHALAQLDSLAGSAERQTSLPEVRISVTPSFARYWLIPRLVQIEDTPARLRMQVQTDWRHADLVNGETDLVVRYGLGNWGIGVEQKMFNEMLCPVVSARLMKTGMAGNAQAVAKLPLLHVADTAGWRAWGKRYVPRWRQKEADRTFSDYGQCLEAAQHGLGVALWNRAMHGAQSLGPGLVLLDGLDVANPLAHYLIRRHAPVDAPPNVAAQRLLALCGESV